MAPTTISKSRQTKATTKKRVPSPEQQDSSQGSSAAMADSQGADEINAMIATALEEVILFSKLDPLQSLR